MTGPTSDAPAARPRLNGIGVIVSDMAAAVSFYSRLGLTFPDDAATQDHTEAALVPGVTLMLDTESSIREIYPDVSVGGEGRLALAAELPTPADVDRVYGELAAEGFGMREPWDAFWGQRYANVHDPDGTQVDLYAALTPSGGPPSGEG